MKSKNNAGVFVWVGRGLSTLGVLPFFFSAFMKFSANPQMLEGWSHLGWPKRMLMTVALLEVTSVVFYLIPQVSVLGAILLTGYLGGAISTHLRIGEAVLIQVVLGVLIWGGLYFRESRLRAILPFR